MVIIIKHLKFPPDLISHFITTLLVIAACSNLHFQTLSWQPWLLSLSWNQCRHSDHRHGQTSIWKSKENLKNPTLNIVFNPNCILLYYWHKVCEYWHWFVQFNSKMGTFYSKIKCVLISLLPQPHLTKGPNKILKHCSTLTEQSSDSGAQKCTSQTVLFWLYWSG